MSDPYLLKIRSLESQNLDLETKLIDAKLTIGELIEAGDKAFAAIDKGQMRPTQAVCGQTSDACLRASAYFKVPAWDVEDAREKFLTAKASNVVTKL